jgi:hypothetical protein
MIISHQKSKLAIIFAKDVFFFFYLEIETWNMIFYLEIET